jgi:hypothetical protein
LGALLPTLSALGGRTVVLLLTDGGPNCNAAASCEASECMPNIEGDCLPSENCCAVGHPLGGPELCVDRSASVAAVEAIADAGVPVYVIGIPGSATYSAVLDEMAEAGGTARAGAQAKYHRVDDLAVIEQVFRDIATENVTCELQLQDPPEQQGYTNVYLDCQLVALDESNGWTWEGEDKVVLHGEACAALKAGNVYQVKVVSGCPTEDPR